MSKSCQKTSKSSYTNLLISKILKLQSLIVENMKIKFLEVYVGIESNLNQLANLNITERDTLRAEKL